MKGILSVLLALALGCLTGFSHIVIQPEYRINKSAFSDRILLVDVTKVTLTDEKVENGIGSREIFVEGTAVEVIRGKQQSKKFHASKCLTRVVDSKAAKAKYGAESVEVFSLAQHDDSGISDCQTGKRYIVNYPGSDARFREAFFAEVAKDNEDWRKKILPRKHPENEAPPKAK